MTGADEVRHWLALGRDGRMDWLPGEASTERIARSLVALANARGGRLLLGVSPRMHRLDGVADAQAATGRLLSAGCLIEPPLVLPIPDAVEVNGRTVMVIRVPPGLPHIHALDGRYFVRDGSTTTTLSAPRLRRLLHDREGPSPEQDSPSEATVEDLDPELVAAYLRRLPGSIDGVASPLHARGCLREVDGRDRPTMAGLLLFGRRPQRWAPDAVLTARTFHGRSDSAESESVEFGGCIPSQLEAAAHSVRVADEAAASTRFERWSRWPGIGELLVNALAHRDYGLEGGGIRVHAFTDRLEVLSPGRLPGSQRPDRLLRAQAWRNPVVIQILADLGYASGMGVGISRVCDAARESGSRLPDFDETGGFFRVTLYPRGRAAGRGGAHPGEAKRDGLDSSESDGRLRVGGVPQGWRGERTNARGPIVEAEA